MAIVVTGVDLVGFYFKRLTVDWDLLQRRTMRFALSALLALFTAACYATGGETADSICSDAELLPEVCGDLAEATVAGGKADDIAEMRGIVVERTGNRTYFKIPLAYTVGGDKRRLLDETMERFSAKLGELNGEMIDRGLDISALLGEADRAEFEENYFATLESVFDSDIEGDMAIHLGDTVDEPRKLRVWHRYVTPQAFIVYFGTKFSVNVGIGGGISATVLVVAQPWLSLGIDHTLEEPVVVDKRYELDVAILGVPNVDVGFGVGGGIPIRLGVGTVFGPLDHPNDLAGWGAGISGAGTLPIIGGAQAKVVSVLKSPPLFLAMLGYNSGSSGGWELHGNIQRILDLGEFLDWIGQQVDG